VSAPSTGGQLVYAIGDVHGCYEAMKALLARITRDAAATARGRRPILIFLGDYVDRGPQSNQVLEALVWLQRRAEFELHALKGNHEQALLGFLADPLKAAAWLRWGGTETLQAYGVVSPEGQDAPAPLQQARDELLEHMPAAHLWRLQTLETMVCVGDYVFVHAGVRPGVRLADQREDDLLWIRQPFLETAGAHEKMVVHGHTWVDERPQLRANRLGLDTGCYATGVLSAVRLDGDACEVLQARAEMPAGAF
jgi:serine/threonine protein phosphatase 1